jgi:cell division protease FtsH
MSTIGPIALEEESNDQVFLGGGINQNSEYRESMANRIDDEVCKIINYCEQKALQIIVDNRVIIDLIVEKLIESETMEGNEFRELLGSYTILPYKNEYLSNM